MTTETNPWEISVAGTIDRLRRARNMWGWQTMEPELLSDENIDRFEVAAPPWPVGRSVFRSVRLRFGNGIDGVNRTILQHCYEIERIHNQTAARDAWKMILNPGLRLIAGEASHHPTLEWIYIDIGCHRNRATIGAVRGGLSLADEIFAFAWLFPKYVDNIDGERNPGLFAAGYEYEVASVLNGKDHYVPHITNNRISRTKIGASHIDNRSPEFSVPEILPLP